MRPGWKDKPNGPSVFAIQVMATKGPLLLVEVPPWTATVKDGHAENGRANKPPVTPMSQDFLLSLLRPFFTFISFSSPLLSPPLSPRGRDVVKFRTTRICWGGREGHENSSISYWKVCCGPRIRDLVIYIHGMWFSLFPSASIFFIFRFRGGYSR